MSTKAQDRHGAVTSERKDNLLFKALCLGDQILILSFATNLSISLDKITLSVHL